MSPVERVDSWRVGSSSQASSSVTNKRKRPITPTKGAGRPRKLLKTDDEEVDLTPEIDDESDVVEGDGEEREDDEAGDASSSSSNIRVAPSSSSKSPSSKPSTRGYEHEDEEDSIDIDETLVISEEEYQRSTPKKKKVISPTTEHFSRGVSTEELRAQGWDDEHITLVQKLAMRGFEPLMPHYWKFDYRFMPDALFSATDEAFICSVRGDHYRGMMALEKLLELGGRVRDRVYLKGRVKPEEQTRRMLSEYMKWADDDSGLDRKTAIPLLALETKPADTPATELQANARRKLARLAARYREAFRISQSIEGSPGSRTSAQLSHPVPTLYAFIASHTLVALVAYNPDDEQPEIKSVAFFDMKDKDYDVWNVLALAITLCHVRDVQIRISEETGLGVKDARAGEEEGEEGVGSDDPDA